MPHASTTVSLSIPAHLHGSALYVIWPTQILSQGNELVFITVRAPPGSANSISHNSMQSAISPTWILDYRARAFIYLSFLPSAYSSSLRFSSDISIFLSPCVLCIALYANPPWNVYQVISSSRIGCDDDFLNKVLPKAVLYNSSKIQRNRC